MAGPSYSEVADDLQRAAQSRVRYMLAGPVFHAMLSAQVAFRGRDRRRIKREVNKAVRRAWGARDAYSVKFFGDRYVVTMGEDHTATTETDAKARG